VKKKADWQGKYNNHNLIFVLCGPSGVGKTSLKISLLEKHHDVKLCPSVTTRPETNSPHNIQEYHYLSETEYEQLYESGELITRKIRQFGFYYGIRYSEIIDILNKGYHVLLETTLWGIDQLRKHFNNVISIFVAPPSLEELKRRLKNRKRESDAEITQRFGLAEQVLDDFKEEMVEYYLVNEDLAESIDIINSIVSQEKLKLDNEHAESF